MQTLPYYSKLTTIALRPSEVKGLISNTINDILISPLEVFCYFKYILCLVFSMVEFPPHPHINYIIIFEIEQGEKKAVLCPINSKFTSSFSAKIKTIFQDIKSQKFLETFCRQCSNRVVFTDSKICKLSTPQPPMYESATKS